MKPRFTRYAQSALRIDLDDLTVYIDPFKIPDGEPPADVLLLSHDHGDHLSQEDIDKVRTSETAVFAAQDPVADKIDGPVTGVSRGDTVEHNDLTIRVVPAYTLTKYRDSGELTHPSEAGHVGFILEKNQVTIYSSGDTDVIPEMSDFGKIDYAFLPVSGVFVMTAEEAAEAVRIIKPDVAIPVHYGAIVGSEEDANRFASLVPDDVRVWIMEPQI